MARILLVEDEPDIAKLVSNWLHKEQHTVDIISHGDEALAELLAAKNKYEVVILDLMLPGHNGLDICRRYRGASGNAPVLMLTAKEAIEDKEMGFKAGADDYITKPFHLKELSARVEALLRRGILVPRNRLVAGDLEMDLAECTVTKSGNPVHLSPKEFGLLEFLMKHPHQVFSSEDIIEHVWEPDSDAMHDTVRGHINRLRRKIDTPGAPSLIANVYGFGYKFEG